MFIDIQVQDGMAAVTLTRGKVNALNGEFVAELTETFAGLAEDSRVRSAVLTGREKFFSFGFDVPEMYDFTPEQFTDFLISYCELYKQLFLFPKPLVAAINGHCVAGGYILALTADSRIMVEDKAKVALNEITFGSSIFAGAVEMLRFTAGSASASRVLLTGAMFSPQQALSMGLVDELTTADTLYDRAVERALTLSAGGSDAFAGLKRLLRQPAVDDWMLRERGSIQEFVEIWYSAETRAMTKRIEIR